MFRTTSEILSQERSQKLGNRNFAENNEKHGNQPQNKAEGQVGSADLFSGKGRKEWLAGDTHPGREAGRERTAGVR